MAVTQVNDRHWQSPRICPAQEPEDRSDDGGQGRGITADLPLFRQTDNSQCHLTGRRRAVSSVIPAHPLKSNRQRPPPHMAGSTHHVRPSRSYLSSRPRRRPHCGPVATRYTQLGASLPVPEQRQGHGRYVAEVRCRFPAGRAFAWPSRHCKSARRPAPITPHRGRQLIHNPDAHSVRVDHPPVPERPVVAPHRGQVAFGEPVLPRRRVGHVQVVALDEAMPDARSRRQLNMNLVAHAALADARPSAERREPRSGLTQGLTLVEDRSAPHDVPDRCRGRRRPADGILVRHVQASITGRHRPRRPVGIMTFTLPLSRRTCSQGRRRKSPCTGLGTGLTFSRGATPSSARQRST